MRAAFLVHFSGYVNPIEIRRHVPGVILSAGFFAGRIVHPDTYFCNVAQDREQQRSNYDPGDTLYDIKRNACC